MLIYASSSYLKRKEFGGFLSQTTVLDTLRPFSSFYLMNIIMMVRMSAMFLRRETFETFLTYCIIMVIASSTKQYPLGHAKVSFENFDTLTDFSGIV